MVGGAFSLSPAVESWVGSVALSGLGTASVVSAAVVSAAVSAGGLGNSWMICACQTCRSRLERVCPSPHPGDAGCTAASRATRRCQPLSATCRSAAHESTHGSSEPWSAALCSVACAAGVSVWLRWCRVRTGGHAAGVGAVVRGQSRGQSRVHDGHGGRGTRLRHSRPRDPLRQPALIGRPNLVPAERPCREAEPHSRTAAQPSPSPMLPRVSC